MNTETLIRELKNVEEKHNMTKYLLDNLIYQKWHTMRENDWIKENLDAEDMVFESIQITDYPVGREQNNGEYCNQSVGACGDDFYGYYYWPMDNGKYMCMYFEC